MKTKSAILAALVAVTTHAQANTVQIRVEGEPTPITLPFNQRLGAWTKIYGMGSHNPSVKLLGYGIAWSLHRVEFVAVFTGQPLIATRVALSAREGQKALSPEEATQIAHSLGLKNKQSDPNMEGAMLWPGDALSLRYLSEEGLDETMVEIWSDQDRTGGLLQEE